jgi:hypothetical protein
MQRGENTVMYVNPALLEMELKKTREKYIREPHYRYANGELIHASGRTWRETRPFRTFFGRAS